MNNDKIKEEFEDFAAGSYGLDKFHNGTYKNSNTRSAWYVWQSAHKRICAKLSQKITDRIESAADCYIDVDGEGCMESAILVGEAVAEAQEAIEEIEGNAVYRWRPGMRIVRILEP